MKKLDGSYFCGKDIGGAIFGCSENWKCHNCKKCQTWPNYNKNNSIIKNQLNLLMILEMINMSVVNVNVMIQKKVLFVVKKLSLQEI